MIAFCGYYDFCPTHPSYPLHPHPYLIAPNLRHHQSQSSHICPTLALTRECVSSDTCQLLAFSAHCEGAFADVPPPKPLALACSLHELSHRRPSVVAQLRHDPAHNVARVTIPHSQLCTINHSAYVFDAFRQLAIAVTTTGLKQR